MTGLAQSISIIFSVPFSSLSGAIRIRNRVQLLVIRKRSATTSELSERHDDHQSVALVADGLACAGRQRLLSTSIEPMNVSRSRETLRYLTAPTEARAKDSSVRTSMLSRGGVSVGVRGLTKPE